MHHIFSDYVNNINIFNCQNFLNDCVLQLYFELFQRKNIDCIFSFIHIFSSEVVRINELTDCENNRSVWRQTQYDVTDKNNIICFEGLNIHYH